jgi:hypothetical protein
MDLRPFLYHMRFVHEVWYILVSVSIEQQDWSLFPRAVSPDLLQPPVRQIRGEKVVIALYPLTYNMENVHPGQQETQTDTPKLARRQTISSRFVEPYRRRSYFQSFVGLR